MFSVVKVESTLKAGDVVAFAPTPQGTFPAENSTISIQRLN